MNSKISNITQKWVDILMPFTKEYSNKITASELEKITNIPQQTISRVLNELVKINLINYEISGKNKYYYLNLSLNKSKILLEIIENKKTLDFILNKSNINLIIEEILKFSDSVIIFGSFADNKENKNSDLDLIIINGKDEEIKNIKNKNTLEINYENLKYKDLKESLKQKNPLSIEIKEKHIFFGEVSKLVKIFIE